MPLEREISRNGFLWFVRLFGGLSSFQWHDPKTGNGILFFCFSSVFLLIFKYLSLFYSCFFLKKLSNKSTAAKSSHGRGWMAGCKKWSDSGTVADGQTSAAGLLRDERGWRAGSVRHEHGGTAYVGV